jgi:hypothetical protein
VAVYKQSRVHDAIPENSANRNETFGRHRSGSSRTSRLMSPRRISLWGGAGTTAQPLTRRYSTASTATCHRIAQSRSWLIRPSIVGTRGANGYSTSVMPSAIHSPLGCLINSARPCRLSVTPCPRQPTASSSCVLATWPKSSTAFSNDSTVDLAELAHLDAPERQPADASTV